MFFDLRQGNYTFKHERSIEQALAPGESFKEHFHSVFELLYFIDGEADFMIQHTLYNLHPHSLLVIKPGELHQVLIRSDAPYERIVIRFDESDLPRGFRSRIRNLKSVYPVGDTTVAEELMRLDTHTQLPVDEARFYACRAELNLILTHLCVYEDRAQTADEVNEDIYRIMHHINENLTEIMTMEDLCAALHMSRSNLNKIFSSRFDTPIMSYIRTQKTTLAHSLLNEGFPPTEIPGKCGFNNYSSFYRAYMKIYGTSPSAVRR